MTAGYFFQPVTRLLVFPFFLVDDLKKVFIDFKAFKAFRRPVKPVI